MKSKKPNTKRFQTIKNGCGGNKGTKCGVEVYYMPSDSKPAEVKL
jgi:hypothetical protein